MVRFTTFKPACRAESCNSGSGGGFLVGLPVGGAVFGVF